MLGENYQFKSFAVRFLNVNLVRNLNAGMSGNSKISHCSHQKTYAQPKKHTKNVKRS